MNKLIGVAMLITLVLIFVIPVILTLPIKELPNDKQPSLGNTLKVYGDIRISQSFQSTDNNLAGIGTSIKNPNFANKKITTINIYDDKGMLLRTVELNGRNIADGKFVKIRFDLIPDSKDKEYSWEIFSRDSTFDDALEFFLTKNAPVWSKKLQINNQVTPGGLSYVTLHKVVNPLTVLNKVLLGLVGNLISDLSFFVIYTLIVFGLLGALIFLDLKGKKS